MDGVGREAQHQRSRLIDLQTMNMARGRMNLECVCRVHARRRRIVQPQYSAVRISGELCHQPAA